MLRNSGLIHGSLARCLNITRRWVDGSSGRLSCCVEARGPSAAVIQALNQTRTESLRSREAGVSPASGKWRLPPPNDICWIEMLRRRELAWVMLTWLAALSAGCDGASGFDTRELDLRSFQRFRIDQTPSLTPEGCPTPYLVDPAEIERVGDGEYQLTFSMAFASEEQFWECLDAAADPNECDHAEPLPGVPRTLSEADLSELMALFASVSVNFAPDPCDGIGDDPCNINQLEWDDLTSTDRSCTQTEPWISTEFANQVLQAVTDLTRPEAQK